VAGLVGINVTPRASRSRHPNGIFPDAAQLAKDLAAAVMAVRTVRVQVLTNAGALDREKQIAVVRKLTELIAAGRR